MRAGPNSILLIYLCLRLRLRLRCFCCCCCCGGGGGGGGGFPTSLGEEAGSFYRRLSAHPEAVWLRRQGRDSFFLQLHRNLASHSLGCLAFTFWTPLAIGDHRQMFSELLCGEPSH